MHVCVGACVCDWCNTSFTNEGLATLWNIFIRAGSLTIPCHVAMETDEEHRKYILIFSEKRPSALKIIIHI